MFRCSSLAPWWPAELLATHNVQMQVVHTLATLRSVIDHDTVSGLQALLLGNMLSYIQQVTQQHLVVLLSLAQPGQALAVLH